MGEFDCVGGASFWLLCAVWWMLGAGVSLRVARLPVSVGGLLAIGCRLVSSRFGSVLMSLDVALCCAHLQLHCPTI